ncbi:MAG: hypothetical protein NT136_02355 [Candidatus Moranbacteria bacterium]|nr:hypothetical protein [Candidatus Moranbacteria bacterium]
MQFNLVKLSKRIGKQEIRLIVFECNVSVRFDFPIMSGDCKISDQDKEEIISYLEEMGLSLEQRNLIAKNGISFDSSSYLLAYIEALLTVFNNEFSLEFSRKISANNFIGTVKSKYCVARERMVHGILGQSTAIAYFKEIGYGQIVDVKKEGQRTAKEKKSFFRKILTLF